MFYIVFCNIVKSGHAALHCTYVATDLHFKAFSANMLSKLSAFLSFTISLAVLQQCRWSPPNQKLH